MVNKNFKQNLIIKYLYILLLNLILVLSMGATNIFGILTEQEKTERVTKAVESAKKEREEKNLSDKEVTDDQLQTAAQNQVNNTDDTKNTEEEVTKAVKKVVTDYITKRDKTSTEETPVEVSTVVTGDLGEQTAELTDETVKAAVENKYSTLKIDEVTVTIDAANKQVTVSAKADSKVYKGTATVKYTVKVPTSDKPWHKSVLLWGSVSVASAVAVVGVVYYLNKNKKFKK